MRSFLFLPTLKRPSGGAAVLARMAAMLVESGREVVVVTPDRPKPGATLPDLDDQSAAPPTIPLDKAAPEKGDIWLVPEGWVNALAPGLNAQAHCLVYVQNHAFMFSALPKDVFWNQLEVTFLAVSDPVARYVELFTGKYPPVLRPGIDLERFHAPESKPSGLRIGYMPRKNKAQAEQVLALFAHRNPGLGAKIAPLDGLAPDQVADSLRACHLFLCSGFPEGLGLPPLEAMACGCLCAGFTGFGGLDYMRQATDADVDMGMVPGMDSSRFKPWLPLRDVPWGGNGLWCADADIADAALCLDEAAHWLTSNDPRALAALAEGKKTAAAYSLDAMRRNLLDLWERLGA